MAQLLESLAAVVLKLQHLAMTNRCRPESCGTPEVTGSSPGLPHTLYQYNLSRYVRGNMKSYEEK